LYKFPRPLGNLQSLSSTCGRQICVEDASNWEAIRVTVKLIWQQTSRLLWLQPAFPS